MSITTQKFGVLFAEAVGTFVLTMVAVSASQLGIPMFTGAAVGFTLAVLVLSLGAYSGTHINPAVTFGLMTIKKISPLRALAYILAQFVGAFSAWKLVNYFAENDKTTGLLSWTSSVEWSKAADRKVFFAELIGTAIFGFGIASAVYQKFEGTKAAMTIGSSLFLGVMLASLGSAAVVNPAVAYGTRNWTWIYLLAPILGSVLGMNLFALLFTEDWMPAIKKQIARTSGKTVTTVKKKS